VETAAEQLKRPLPSLRQAQTTQSISTRGRYLHPSYISRWPGFIGDVKAYIQACDLSFEVASEGCLDEEVLVGNEASLVGRLLQNIGVSVGRVLQKVDGTHGLRFGDAYCGDLETSSCIPDVMLLHDSSFEVRMVGEAKPFWRLRMENVDPDAPERTMRLVMQPLGKTVFF
jgi:hypothetical protein